MITNALFRKPSRIVLVVGVDLTNISPHLLSQTRDLVRTVDEAEIHVVHVVRPESPLLRAGRPEDAKDAGVAHQVDHAQRLVAELCGSLADPHIRVSVHTPVGDPVQLLARVAADVGADVLVVEAHPQREHAIPHVLRRSIVDHISAAAPCTVLTIRTPPPRFDDGWQATAPQLS